MPTRNKRKDSFAPLLESEERDNMLNQNEDNVMGNLWKTLYEKLQKSVT